jgi:hypothetical protein
MPSAASASAAANASPATLRPQHHRDGQLTAGLERLGRLVDQLVESQRDEVDVHAPQSTDHRGDVLADHEHGRVDAHRVSDRAAA